MTSVLMDSVSMHYGETPALHNVNLRVGDAESVVLLGPTGSGKTTLLRLIAGLEEPTSGEVLFDGKPVAPGPEGRDVTMMFSHNRLYPKMSARSNIGFPLTVRRTPQPEKSNRIEAEARALGIERLLDRLPKTLSEGQSNLVNLAKAMVRSPGLFLIDEPFGALDAGARRLLREELRSIQKGYGVTAVYATHDQEDAMTLADQLVIIEGGRISQIGEPLAVYREPANMFVATFLGSPSMSILDAQRAESGILLGDYVIDADTAAVPREFLLGVRPERWEIAKEGVRASLVALEDFGDTAYLSMESQAGHFVMRWTDDRPEIGALLTVVPTGYHLFDRETGRSVAHF